MALNRRYYSSTILLKRFLKKNDSKRIIEINDQEINKNLPLNKIKISKYWMYCNSIHLIDFIYYLSRGKIVKIINNGKIKDDYVTSKLFFHLVIPYYIKHYGIDLDHGVSLYPPKKLLFT